MAGAGRVDRCDGGRRRPSPSRVRFAPWIRLPKEVVFEICGALEIAEEVLRRAGDGAAARQAAALREGVEGALAR